MVKVHEYMASKDVAHAILNLLFHPKSYSSMLVQFTTIRMRRDDGPTPYSAAIVNGLLSNVVPQFINRVNNALSSAAMVVGRISWASTQSSSMLYGRYFLLEVLRTVVRMGEKLIPSMITNVTITSMDEPIKASVKGQSQFRTELPIR
jgi:hypothetical protein